MLDYGGEDAFWKEDIIGKPRVAQKLEESPGQAGNSLSRHG